MLGYLFARYRYFDETFGFVVVALQTVPSIAWLPFAIIWFGLNDTSVIFITTIGATWTMSMASRTGILNISPIHLRAAQMLGTGSGYRIVFSSAAAGWHFPIGSQGFEWLGLLLGGPYSRGAYCQRIGSRANAAGWTGLGDTAYHSVRGHYYRRYWHDFGSFLFQTLRG